MDTFDKSRKRRIIALMLSAYDSEGVSRVEDKVTVSFPTRITVNLNAEISEWPTDTAIGLMWDRAREYETQLTEVIRKALENWKVGDIHVICQPETKWKK